MDGPAHPAHIAVDHEIGLPAHHDQMFKIVATHQNQPAAGLDHRAFQHGKPAAARFERLIRLGLFLEPIGAAALSKPHAGVKCRGAEQQGDDQQEQAPGARGFGHSNLLSRGSGCAEGNNRRNDRVVQMILGSRQLWRH
jgi:hypothetical protein